MIVINATDSSTGRSTTRTSRRLYSTESIVRIVVRLTKYNLVAGLSNKIRGMIGKAKELAKLFVKSFDVLFH